MSFNDSPDATAGWAEDTRAVRGGLLRSDFQETSEAIFLNSGFVYSSAEAAERAFTGEEERFVYSRYGNPSVATFQERLRLLEGTEACFATASGMSAVFTALAALLGAGDRVVAARSLFGSCFVILNEILPRWGVTTVFVDGPDLDQWRDALSEPTTAVFFESPSNPMQEIVDIQAVADLAHAAGATVVVDNVFATPLLQRSLDFGADVVVYSGTKHIDGQGRVLGGAVLGTKEFIEGPVKNLMRHTGPALSAFNAWVLTKGLETMGLRVRHASANALAIGEWLEAQPQVTWVRYPHLRSHPQYELARKQMSAGGTVLTFEVAGGKEAAFRLLNGLQVIDISNNLGDSKSLITHPATTTHRAMGPEGRAAIGLGDGVVRLSVGLEDVGDLIGDLSRAMA
ncbi:O-succinylhomoserine sulfhydrylase [Sinomonas cellulolyticus]|uniref:O-succinylhomoserine sulfhydrylase n=1 Tax=Sinomonas cellulolyticus TaxID=2801916 RepID=A0ABS1K1P2_9MICC|nr:MULTISPECIES: O-succinylhomoserine sulfhydrylase [Sinomonas]MBL0705589.1 O-succinylhomoserine sulfhydrylase [Sinomonas cellulolyticus]GHG51476.1 O-succinylhomoserine sulfhydrylase [Sinomonas sp. KCTC 49339]